MYLHMSKKNKAIFKKFFLSYILILVITLLISGILYDKALIIIEQDSKESIQFMLKQSVANIDNFMEDIDSIYIQFAFNNKLNDLTYMDKPEEGSNDVFKIWDFSKELESISVTNKSFKSTFYIFLEKSSIVFSRSNAYFDFNNFYGNVLSYNNMNYSEWCKIFFQNNYNEKVIPKQNIKSDQLNNSVITYLRSLPISSSGSNKAVVAFLIDDNQIRNIMSSINKAGSVFIFDNSGKVIDSVTDKEYDFKDISKYIKNNEGNFIYNHQGENMLVVYKRSEYNKWMYVAILPIEAIMKKSGYVKSVAIVLGIITLILGIVISGFLAYYNSKPIKDMVSILKEFLKGKIYYEKCEDSIDEYDFLRGNICNIIDDSRRMENSLIQKSEALKSVFFDRLLRGEFSNDKTMRKFLSYIGIDIFGDKFVSFVFKINRRDSLISNEILEELDVLRTFIENILNKDTSTSNFVHSINENQIAIVLSLDSDNAKNFDNTIMNIIVKVKEKINSSYHIVPITGIGNIYDNLFDICYSFKEARLAVESWNEEIADTDIWYKNIDRSTNGYFYSMEAEMKLINSTKSGNETEVKKLLSIIYNENFISKKVSADMIRFFLYDMQCSLLKLTEEIHVDFIGIGENKGIDDKKIFNDLEQVFYKICNKVNSSKKSHNTALRDKIIEYVSAKYMDSNICISNVASEFNLSESYFSLFFKEQIGEPFSNYIERIRIQKACNIMSDEKDNIIEQIAFKVGYNSAYSFRRAFKKVMGVSPSMYK